MPTPTPTHSTRRSPGSGPGESYTHRLGQGWTLYSVSSPRRYFGRCVVDAGGNCKWQSSFADDIGPVAEAMVEHLKVRHHYDSVAEADKAWAHVVRAHQKTLARSLVYECREDDHPEFELSRCYCWERSYA